MTFDLAFDRVIAFGLAVISLGTLIAATSVIATVSQVISSPVVQVIVLASK